MNELLGKTALVTGGSRGIGRAIAIALAEAGSDVVVNFREQAAKAREVEGQILAMGRKCAVIQADVSRAEEVRRLAEEAGPVDILVNNAGIARVQTVDNVTEEDWDELMTVNLKSCFLVTQAFLTGMRARRWGRIINLSSVAAQIGGIVGPHYAASKSGMHGLTHFYARHLAREGITANVIAPALIESDMLAGNPNAVPELVPMGRFGLAEEVASVAVMLAQNGFITGQTIDVNGGLYMT